MKPGEATRKYRDNFKFEYRNCGSMDIARLAAHVGMAFRRGWAARHREEKREAARFKPLLTKALAWIESSRDIIESLDADADIDGEITECNKFIADVRIALKLGKPKEEKSDGLDVQTL